MQASFITRAKKTVYGFELSMAKLDDGEFRDPFVHETLARVQPSLQPWALPLPLLTCSEPEHSPAGFIFHMGRCGSTLVAQVLKETGAVVISEPLAINDVLSPENNIPRSDLISMLRLILHNHATSRACTIIKFRSWNTLYLPMFIEAFPDVPWIFVARDPVEALVSIMKRPCTWARTFLNGSNIFHDYLGIGSSPICYEEYLAKFLAKILQIVTTNLNSRGLIIPYTSLPSSIWAAVAPHFGLKLSSVALNRMESKSRIYSKDPNASSIFQGDSAEKQLAASPALRKAVANNTGIGFRRLLTKLPSSHDEAPPDSPNEVLSIGFSV
jgi:hypothetical protein